MNIDKPGIYHIFNRGINQQRVFYNRVNYHYFLDKCFVRLKPISEILAWCLSPAHFDFLLEVTPASLLRVKQGIILMPAVSNAFRIIQSHYAKGLNKQIKRSGNLFQQKARSNFIDDHELALSVYHFIHQIPIKDRLVRSAEEWPHSSYTEYTRNPEKCLCNKKRASNLLMLNDQNIKSCLELNMTIEKYIGAY